MRAPISAIVPLPKMISVGFLKTSSTSYLSFRLTFSSSRRAAHARPGLICGAFGAKSKRTFAAAVKPSTVFSRFPTTLSVHATPQNPCLLTQNRKSCMHPTPEGGGTCFQIVIAPLQSGFDASGDQKGGAPPNPQARENPMSTTIRLTLLALAVICCSPRRALGGRTANRVWPGAPGAIGTEAGHPHDHAVFAGQAQARRSC